MADAEHPAKYEGNDYESAGGWKIAFISEKGERTSTKNEPAPTASGARSDIGEAALAVRQRYSGQSGVEQVFALRVFSLLHASQHALDDTFGAGAETNGERPVNMKNMTTRSERLTDFGYDDCIASLYCVIEKKQL